MDTQRQIRFGELIRSLLSDCLLKEDFFNENINSSSITISFVRMSKDLKIANVYFTSDVDAKNRIRSLNEFFKINLNAIRRAGMHDDGVFNDCQLSDKSLMMKIPLMIAKQM